MARPVKQTVDYFPHDTDASAGRTLTILEHKFGNDGYAFWFKLLELLGRTRGHYFAYNDDDSFEFLLAKMGIKDTVIAHTILATLSTMGAIDKELYEHKIIWSQNFVDGIADVYDRRKLPLPVKPDWRVLEGTNEVSNDNNPVSDNRSTQTKVKETKLNNIRVKETSSSFEDKEAKEIWEKCLGILKEEVNQANFRTWLKGTVGLLYKVNVFIIGVPNEQVGEHLMVHQRSMLENVLGQVTGKRLGLGYRIIKKELKD